MKVMKSVLLFSVVSLFSIFSWAQTNKSVSCEITENGETETIVRDYPAQGVFLDLLTN